MHLSNDWKGRFVDISRHVAVECAFVFGGEQIELARRIKWPATHVYDAAPRCAPNGNELGERRKVYLFGLNRNGQLAAFNLMQFDDQCAQLGIAELYVEWTFLRKNSRIVCALTNQNEFFGFGRTYNPSPELILTTHQLLAGPVVDYRLGRKDGWKFEPVLMKIEGGAGKDPVYLELSPEWGAEFVTMKALTLLPSQVPARLAEYEFRQSAKKRQGEFDERLLRLFADFREGHGRRD